MRRRLDIVAVLALMIGLYGAGLATWSYLREEDRAAERSREQFSVDSRVSHSRFRRTRTGQVWFVSGRFVVTVKNTGFRPVTIERFAFVTNVGAKFGTVYRGARLPRRLEENAEVKLVLDLAQAGRGLIRASSFYPRYDLRIVGLEVTDSTGLVVGERLIGWANDEPCGLPHRNT